MSVTDPQRGLAISYALRGRDGVTAVFALDDRLADIVRRASDPLIGQMRLTWWREALEALDTTPPPAEPILRTLADQALPLGASGAELAKITHGWEALLEEPFGRDAIARHGARGAALFAALAAITGTVDNAVAEAGRGWALADLAAHLGDADRREEAAAMARRHLAVARDHRWSRSGRMIGALALLARLELDHAAPALRIAQLLRHRLTGH